MNRTISAGIGLTIGMTALAAIAATKAPPQKAPPACAAIAFRALPSGTGDGEQTAGMYKSRHGRIELHADVKQGEPVDYFVVADGKRLAAAPSILPDSAAGCAAEKKLPKPAAAASPCTGQRFKVVVAHAGSARLALLYGLDGSTWHFCNAGSF